MVMHLKSCCCGCSLRTGSVIIGVLTMISGLIGLVVSIFSVSAASGEMQKELVQLNENFADENQLQDDENLEPSYKGLTVTFICLAIVNAFHLILGILLLFGASAEKPHFVRPWIQYSIVITIVQSLLGFTNIIFHFINGLATIGIVGLVFLLVGIIFAVYFILVVNSFHTELISNNYQYKV